MERKQHNPNKTTENYLTVEALRTMLLPISEQIRRLESDSDIKFDKIKQVNLSSLIKKRDEITQKIREQEKGSK